ncbi:hypothetical protein HBI53_008420 [Parastagonospora nodorum]|nr:hypothetical protein HBI84_064150 [Parastagonospora nodorum]KAH6054682.1 hypothetical protein HBI54_018770 [Parastagonospora nodorum]KAH6236924.1 hypothetical protein HBI53_008420 [Parastagonospora nodorum]KAH6553339.1 hypothetical protein HBI07_016750 [Parastagonospora nodorum]
MLWQNSLRAFKRSVVSVCVTFIIYSQQYFIHVLLHSSPVTDLNTTPHLHVFHRLGHTHGSPFLGRPQHVRLKLQCLEITLQSNTLALSIVVHVALSAFHQGRV